MKRPTFRSCTFVDWSGSFLGSFYYFIYFILIKVKVINNIFNIQALLIRSSLLELACNYTSFIGNRMWNFALGVSGIFRFY